MSFLFASFNNVSINPSSLTDEAPVTAVSTAEGVTMKYLRLSLMKNVCIFRSSHLVPCAFVHLCFPRQCSRILPSLLHTCSYSSQAHPSHRLRPSIGADPAIGIGTSSGSTS